MLIKSKKERAEEARRRAVEKERESRRKKMLRTKYGQKPLKHAKKGVQSCMLATLVVLLLILMVMRSFSEKGEVSVWVGFAGLFSAALAAAGLKTGMKGFKEREKNYITCKVGAISNGAMLAGLVAMFIRGLI